jgi:hypothetical protein
VIDEHGTHGQLGGSVSVETKWQSPNKWYTRADGTKYRGDGMWHPHLHVIAEGRFLDKHALSAAWHHATGDSFVVDIRIY